MKTSYLAKADRIKYPIGIFAHKLRWYNGPLYTQLGPKEDFLLAYKKGEIGPKEYTEQFLERVLKPLDPHQVYKELCAIYPDADPDEITLICLEKPSDFCHRHLVAIWLTKAGYPTIERTTFEPKVRPPITGWGDRDTMHFGVSQDTIDNAPD
jgi:hypothetical protein